MRFLQLRLLAYGPFTDLTLDLSRGSEGLHLIYGPNEAGKSSALRAIRDLLYGIPTQTNDNFLHEYSRLRIGAVLRDRQGEQVEVVRRKGQRQTLRCGADEQPLAEDALDRLLRGVDKELFESMFGIDHQRLCEGGAQILQGGGRMGEVLFAAGAGIADLRAVQQRVVAEAEALFKPRASNPAINQGIRQYQEDRKEWKRLQLAVDEWSQRDAALLAAERDKLRLEAALREARATHFRLTRIRDGLTAVTQWRKARADLAALGPLPNLPADFANRRHEAAVGLRYATQQRAEIAAQLERLAGELASVDVPTGLLETDQEIERLRERLGSHRKASDDRARLLSEQTQFQKDIEELLAALGLQLPPDNISSLRVSDQQRERIHELGDQGHGLREKFQSAQATKDRAQRKIAQLERQLAESSLPADPGRLRETLRVAQQAGDLEGARAALAGTVATLAAKAAAGSRKLTHFGGRLEDLPALPVPSAETIDRFDEEGRRTTDRLERLQADLEAARRERSELLDRLRSFDRTASVPTELDLSAARALRDQGWQLILSRLQPETGEPPQLTLNKFLSQFPDANDLWAAYVLSVRQADHLADRLRHEADRVAEKVLLETRAESQATRVAELERRLAELSEQAAEQQQSWLELWRGSGVEPLPPREMRTWLRDKDKLCQLVEQLTAQRQELVQLDQRIHDHTTALLKELRQLDDTGAAGDAPSLSTLVHRAASTVEAWTQAQAQLQSGRQALAAARLEYDEATAALDASQRLMTDWQTEWAREMETLQLSPQASPAEARSVLKNRQQLFVSRAEAESHRLRIEGIDRDAAEFERQVRQVARRVAADLADQEHVTEIVVELGRRLRAAREVAARHAALRGQQEKLQAGDRELVESLHRCQAELQTLCELAGVSAPAELEAVEQLTAKGRTLEASLVGLEEQLLARSDGKGLEAFVAEVEAEQHQADTLPARMDEAERAAERLEEERDICLATLEQERLALSQMSGSAAAAEKAQHCEQLVTRLQDQSRQYAVLRIAAHLLRTGIERYREKNQGPVLEAASRLFAELTLGAYTGLGCDFNEQGEPILVGLRGERRHQVLVAAMSDGTRDQLYLALRLASLELWLQSPSRAGLPFIVDDVLVHFDDDRALPALRALGELSRRTQVIFFTHHQHLVELASAHLPDELLFVHRLERTTSLTLDS